MSMCEAGEFLRTGGPHAVPFRICCVAAMIRGEAPPIGGGAAIVGGEAPAIDGEAARIGGEAPAIGGAAARIGGEAAGIGGAAARIGGEAAGIGGEAAPIRGEAALARPDPPSVCLAALMAEAVSGTAPVIAGAGDRAS